MFHSNDLMQLSGIVELIYLCLYIYIYIYTYIYFIYILFGGKGLLVLENLKFQLSQDSNWGKIKDVSVLNFRFVIT